MTRFCKHTCDGGCEEDGRNRLGHNVAGARQNIVTIPHNVWPFLHAGLFENGRERVDGVLQHMLWADVDL